MKPKNISPRNENGRFHGYWERYLYGKIRYKSFYNDGNLVGYEEDYWIGDELPYKIFYI